MFVHVTKTPNENVSFFLHMRWIKYAFSPSEENAVKRQPQEIPTTASTTKNDS